MKFLVLVSICSLSLLLAPHVAGFAGDDGSDCHVNPDPHFLTFDNIYYDYQLSISINL